MPTRRTGLQDGLTAAVIGRGFEPYGIASKLIDVGPDNSAPGVVPQLFDVLSIWHLSGVMRAIMPSAADSGALMRVFVFHDEVPNATNTHQRALPLYSCTDQGSF